MPAQFDIHQFRSIVKGGFLKPDRYRVRLPIPQAMALHFGDYLPITRNLEFYAESCDFVDVGFTTTNIVRYGYGASEQKPLFPNFDNLMITFYADQAGDNLTFFQDWASSVENFDMRDGILSPTTGDGVYPYEFNYKDDYVVSGMIALLDGRGDEVKTWRVRRMFPIHLPKIKLAFSETRDVMKLTVIFSYMDWYSEVIETPQTPPAGLMGVPLGPSEGTTDPVIARG